MSLVTNTHTKKKPAIKGKRARSKKRPERYDDYDDRETIVFGVENCNMAATYVWLTCNPSSQPIETTYGTICEFCVYADI